VALLTRDKDTGHDVFIGLSRHHALRSKGGLVMVPPAQTRGSHHETPFL